jgi:hypothetical protein
MAVCWNSKTVIFLYGCKLKQSKVHNVICLHGGTVQRSYSGTVF